MKGHLAQMLEDRQALGNTPFVVVISVVDGLDGILFAEASRHSGGGRDSDLGGRRLEVVEACWLGGE